MKIRLLLILMLAFVVMLAGCSGGNETKPKTIKGNKKIKVYTTVYALQDFTEKIGGKYVTVHSVYPPGTDEHSFEPSQKDIISMTDSDLFLYIGHNLEGFVTKADDIFKSEHVQMAPIGEEFKLPRVSNQDTDEGHDHGDVDPHIWLDPILAKKMAFAIKENLVKIKPDQKDYFENNYNELEKKLDKLNTDYKTVIGSSVRKEMIVSHAAYGYWEYRYGLKQLSVTGLSTSDEPSQKQLQNLVKTARDHKLNYVLFEQNVSSKLTDTIQKEIGAKPLTLHNLAVLTDKDIQNKEDYFSIMNHNLETLKIVLNK
ncbi:metal ABC transporter solute-binding protein, Zn/Mn family [Peribacillus kribbensis]|uniref:metal ABC transporter solute-binding protein, Zn/Mn family n=1 Tax=Peribacillus kribbensis TaxID=356658 RepID=UPI0004081B85|nr:zinc ABC transporter substrate-binding protein [Peribacillus kribbensis]